VSYRIFMSHSGIDAPWVHWLAGEAKKIGIEPYIYQHDPQPGREITEKIQTAIMQSNAVVVFLTANSQYSPYVQQEIGFAQGKSKLIIPLVQPGIDARVLAMLTGKEYITFDFQHSHAPLQTFLIYLSNLKNRAEEGQRMALFSFATLLILALTSGGK
jgi:hypothetical protein